MDFAVGDKIAQFFEKADGEMGMITGVIKEIMDDKLVYVTKYNGDIPDGEERIVTVEMYETLI